MENLLLEEEKEFRDGFNWGAEAIWGQRKPKNALELPRSRMSVSAFLNRHSLAALDCASRPGWPKT